MACLHGPRHSQPPKCPGRAPCAFLSIRLKAFRQPRRFAFAGRIALRARPAGATALASVRTFPRLVGMVLADPACVFAEQARLDANNVVAAAHRQRSRGHHTDARSVAEILVGRRATRWLRLNGRPCSSEQFLHRMYRSNSWIGVVAFERRTISRATVWCVSQPRQRIFSSRHSARRRA
jgi:hypothetical protein